MYSKILGIFALLCLFTLHKVYPQTYEQKLNRADSLFSSYRYTEAFEIYRDIFHNSDQFSHQMLLKMAFIKEGMGDYTSSLYYLNLYYNYNPNKKVLKKMEDLASKYKLEGYRYTDIEYFISLYNQYYYSIIFFFLAFATTYFLYLLIKKFRRKKLGFRPLVFILLLAAVYILTNYNLIPPKGIISKSGTVLMSAPSASSDPVALLDKGHRIMILGKEDIWYRILWDSKTAYILQNNLMVVGE
jgi:hypothetical protein